MSARNNRAGKQYERDCANHATMRLFELGGIRANESIRRRAALGLPEDHGDLFGLPIAVQCKNTQQISLSVLDQAEGQAELARLAFGVLLQKRRQRPIGESYAVMAFDSLLALLATPDVPMLDWPRSKID